MPSSQDRDRGSTEERPRRRSPPEPRDADVEQSGGRRRPRRTGPGGAEGDREARRRPALKAGDIAQLALRQVRDLTGKDTEGVTSLERSETGWLVAVEVVEAHRIPNTTDIMAVYEAELDDEGELISYRRIDRYARGQGEQR
ncbi:gas vesicle protein GvpO [Saccharopolyspora kobensis]|uniref:gas vesicle protein GvpO n=1 Tax=Saccharopolyspora kobensis TaxID=146035 RepID=UPI000B803310|nr:gas vesicle protein [Saccharopolyspora kobensis]